MIHGPHGDSASPVDPQIDEERIALLFRRAPVALLTVLVNSTILVLLLSQQISAPILIGWTVATLILTVIRGVLVVSYHYDSARFATLTWENLFAIGALANGIIWGLGTAAFLSADLEYRVGVLFVIGGMVAGASVSSATSPKSFVGFTLFSAIPVLGTLFVGDSPSHWVLATTSLLFVGAVSLIAREGRLVVIDAIRLRLTNETLDRRLAEQSRERAVRLELLLDHAGVVTVVADTATAKIVDVTGYAEPILGSDARSLVRADLTTACDLRPLSSPDHLNRLIRDARASATGAVTLTTPRTDDTGVCRAVELTATVRTIADTEYLLLVLKDATARRALEAELSQSHLLASLGTLSAGFAHEINNPLVGVLANLRLARSTVASASDEDVLEFLDDALVAAERIRQTIANLSTTSASRSSGRRTDSNTESDPRKVVDMLLRIAHTEIRHRAEVEVDAAATPRVRADAMRLYQVLLPLVLQATRAIADGEATRNRIVVRIRHEADRSMVRIDVEDTGAALPPAELARIFEPYSSIGTTSRAHGLGLSVCRNVVTELGGTIEAAPSDEMSTRLTVRLPAARADVPIHVPNRVANDPTPLAALRILIIDDDAFVARALRRLMRNHEVSIETKAANALQKLADERYDLVLCDVMMPDMSGIDFYSAVSTIDQRFADRIIFMTGGAFTRGASDFLEGIDNPCLTKPFDMSELETAIEEIGIGPRPVADQAH